ncbi:forkhead box protein J1 [Indicator indicator]|uniref:forkhead box protein J1 n=1 Tax=Indicator indicator TaxID=1002788 RepID=UPI0023DE7C97|nr:forkhead box protein J1 [Indicator indicator]
MAEEWHVWAEKQRKLKDMLDIDDTLPSLTWLQDFSIKSTVIGEASCYPSGPDPQDKLTSFAAPCSPLAADPACMGIPHTPCKPISSSTSRTIHHTMAMHPHLAEDIDYKTNPHVKPPYSYANLICMAMEASNKAKITLSAIYKWITDNFCYFRHADPTWQNSIRHNLSLNKCFIKVPREKGEPGKGGFWKLDPQYADRLKNGAFKKRRVSPVQIHPAFTKRDQQEPPCLASPATSTCTTSTNVLNINKESQRLLKEFEEVTGKQKWNTAGQEGKAGQEDKAGQKRKQPLPKRTAKVPRLSSCALLTQEEQTELGSLKGDFDWEAIFDTNLNGDFSTFGDLELVPPISTTSQDLDSAAQRHNIDPPQQQEHEQEQVLTEANQNNLDFEETLMATSFLQHPWEEETNDYLSNCINIEQLFEFSDTSLPVDASNWSDLTTLL